MVSWTDLLNKDQNQIRGIYIGAQTSRKSLVSQTMTRYEQFIRLQVSFSHGASFYFELFLWLFEGGQIAEVEASLVEFVSVLVSRGTPCGRVGMTSASLATYHKKVASENYASCFLNVEKIMRC